MVHRPGEELKDWADGMYVEDAGTNILFDSQGRIRSYLKGNGIPDIALMQKQHDTMVSLLEQEGIQVHYLEDPSHYWTNLTFARDVALMTPKGAILTRFAMYFHQGDTVCAQKFMSDQGIPILGAIQGKGTVEGGAFCLLDPQTAVISRSARVNEEGIDQLRMLLSYQEIELIVLDMPASYIHLDEAFIPVDRDKLLVSTFILPDWFLEKCRDHGYTLIETCNEDPLLTNNCLTLEPGKVLFNAKGIHTMENLKTAGVTVIPVDISEINRIGGGVHCATLPLKRDAL